MKKSKTKKGLKVFRLLCLIAYIICAIVLIVESSMNGKNSSAHSTAVGGTIADIINDFKGDQTVAVTPKSLKITNKIEVGYVGKTYKLETKTLPEEATYKQTVFSSSNNQIATIDPTGEISFLLPGEVTITAQNAKYTNIKDSFKINVQNIEIISVTNEINASKNDEGVYVLYSDVDSSAEDYEPYSVTSIVEPLDATHQEKTYKVDKETYIKIDEKGVITPIKYSSNVVTTITVNVGGFVEELKVIVDLLSITHVSGVSIEKESYEIFKTQKLTPKVTVTPSDATFKGYKLTSSNSNVVKVSGTSVVGQGVGEATITLEMSNYPSLKSSFVVQVKAQPSVTDYKVNSSLNIIEGKTGSISISGVTPSYGDISGATYVSDNTSVATVKNGKVTAITPGNATITTTVNGISKTTLVTVSPKVDDVDYLKLSSEINPIVIKGKQYKLNELLFVSKLSFIKNEIEITPIQKSYAYSTLDDSLASIEGAIFTPLALGEIEITITHNSSGAEATITLLVIDDFKISIGEKGNYIDFNEANSMSLNVNDAISYFIEDPEDSEQVYESLEVNSEHTLIYHDGSHTKHDILATSDGESEVVIYPVPLSENEELIKLVKEQFTYHIKLNISHVYSETALVKVYDNLTNQYLAVNEGKLFMYLNDEITFSATPDVHATIHSLSFTSSNEEILSIDNQGKLIPHKIGQVDITLKDAYSSKVNEVIHVTIYNQILINEDQPISVSGYEAVYNVEKEQYEIMNGYSGKIKLHFLDDSTYTKVNYKSSDEKILEVGQDGTLTPHKKGVATITLVVDDGMLDKIEIDAKIRVKPQRVIENMQEFFGKVRKMLGHFGAFLVLGIFSTFTYLLYFTKKKWYWSVPLNFVQGFGLAALTEYIQTFVKGRWGCWSDVVLDTSGFMCSAITLTIIILAIYLIKYLIAKRKQQIKDCK